VIYFNNVRGSCSARHSLASSSRTTLPFIEQNTHGLGKNPFEPKLTQRSNVVDATLQRRPDTRQLSF
jgi:hypothetical protein